MCQTTGHLLGHCDGKTQMLEITLLHFKCISWWALLTFRDKLIPETVFVTVTFCISSSYLKAGWFHLEKYLDGGNIYHPSDLNTSLCWDGARNKCPLFLNCTGSYLVKEGQVFNSIPTPTERIWKSLSSFPIISLHSPIKRIIFCFSKPKFREKLQPH